MGILWIDVSNSCTKAECYLLGFPLWTLYPSHCLLPFCAHYVLWAFGGLMFPIVASWQFEASGTVI